MPPTRNQTLLLATLIKSRAKPLFTLPNEALILTARYLGVKDLASLSLTCMHLSRLLRRLRLKRLIWVKGPTPIEALHWCAENGLSHTAGLVLDEVLDVDETIHGSDSEATALIKAASIGSFETVRLLLLCGANPNRMDSSGSTALAYAATIGAESVARLLLTHPGTLPDSKNSIGSTPLVAAARNGHTGIAEMLLLNGADPLSVDNKLKSVLHSASIFGWFEMITLLCLHGARPSLNWQDEAGHTPLHRAVLAQKADTLRRLVLEGADVNLPNRGGNTPLSLSVKTQNLQITADLISYGADMDLANKAGKMPLHFAALLHDGEMLKKLVRAGASVATKDTSGRTVWHWLAKRPFSLEEDSKACVKAISPEATGTQLLNTQDNDGKTALYYATAFKINTLVVSIIALGVDVNLGDNLGRSPLHVAAAFGNELAMEALLTKGANINITDNSLATPLHTALVSMEDRFAWALMSLRARIDMPNDAGNTAVDLTLKLPKETWIRIFMECCEANDVVCKPRTRASINIPSTAPIL